MSLSAARITPGRVWAWIMGFLGFMAPVWAQGPSVVINEIHANPDVATEEVEFVELYNATDQAVSLAGGTLSGGLGYTFPASVSIAPGKRLVIVDFDPLTQSSRLLQFIAAYGASGLIPGVTLLGPWSGTLANEGERLALEMPQLPDLPGDSISWVVIDEIIYAPLAPWPLSNEGNALERRSTASNRGGSNPANWQVSAPTPGQ